MSCDVGEVTKIGEWAPHSPNFPSLHRSFSNPSVASPTSKPILQTFRRFIYVKAHSPNLPLHHLRHSSFSNPSVAWPTPQLILQPFRCFTSVTAHSPTLLSLFLRHRLYTYVIWRAVHAVFIYGEWKRRCNKEIYELLGHENIVGFVKALRIRWLGHIERVNEEGMPRIILNAKIDSGRRRGRLRKRWVDHLQNNLNSLGIRNWKANAKNSNEWKAVVIEAKVHFYGL